MRSTQRSNQSTVNPTLSPGSTLSNLVRHQAQSQTPEEYIITSGVNTQFSQISLPESSPIPSTAQVYSLLSSDVRTEPPSSESSALVPCTRQGRLFSRSLSSLSNLSHADTVPIITYDTQASHPPSPERTDYPFFLEDTIIRSPHQDPRFYYYAIRRLDRLRDNSSIKPQRRNTEVQRLSKPHQQITFELTVDFDGLNNHPIATATRVQYSTSPYPFITTNLQLVVIEEAEQIIIGKVDFYNPLSGLKCKANFS